ncbi:DUF3822 family protein [Cognatitamlana onchidii]|uniref:DUF3822 family protein n=1 Tax=Cognatitamlana onchidii TaxID=2562860 RepID=UPI0010A69FD4|nr:DUF3822 family protein [Algibacter onchidii]
MALTNNSSNKLTNLELSIQISLSGLSFCILERDSNTITSLYNKDFNKNLNPLEILDHLKHLFKTNKALDSDFKKVSIIHDNDLSVQVPKPLFNEDQVADYLKFNAKILKSDFITFDTIEENDCVCVYVPYININNFIYDKYGTFTFKHISTVLIETILKLEKDGLYQKVYVNVKKGSFEIIVLDSGKLKLYNAFKYTTKEDFIYYLLFTAEQLNLDTEVFKLVLLGNINKNDELYEITYQYIRHVSFGEHLNSFRYLKAPKLSHNHFSLINSL